MLEKITQLLKAIRNNDIEKTSRVLRQLKGLSISAKNILNNNYNQNHDLPVQDSASLRFTNKLQIQITVQQPKKITLLKNHA